MVIESSQVSDEYLWEMEFSFLKDLAQSLGVVDTLSHQSWQHCELEVLLFAQEMKNVHQKTTRIKEMWSLVSWS